MKKGNNQNVYKISFPDWYNDPRDFHDAVMRTYLEGKKLINTGKPKNKKLSQFLYLPIKAEMMGVWYATICSAYILNAQYKKLVLLYPDYKGKEIVGLSEGEIQHEYNNLQIRPEMQIIRKRLDTVNINNDFGSIVSIASCIADFESIDIVGIGIDGDENAVSQELYEKSMEIDDDTCVIVCTAFEREIEYPIMGAYFEGLAHIHKRKPSAVEFATDFGDMVIQVA